MHCIDSVLVSSPHAVNCSLIHCSHMDLWLFEYYEENAATQSLHALEDEETMKTSPRCLVNQLVVVGGFGRQYDQIPGGQLQESVWQC